VTVASLEFENRHRGRGEADALRRGSSVPSLRATRPWAAIVPLVCGSAAAAQDSEPSGPPDVSGPVALRDAAAPSGLRAEPEHRIEVELPEVVVTVHYENRVGTSDAASAGTVTRQLVEDRPILRPGEVLELVPGLVITQHSGAGKANQYFLRGFNLDHGTDFLTTIDGVPVNLRTHGHGQGYTDLNFLVPELIDRVQYFKGPYFASKGDFASAGAADIHYANALARDIVEATGGTFGFARTVAAGSPRIAGGNLLYGLELMHNDGPWAHPDDYRRLNAVVRYSHPVGAATLGVTAMAYAGDWDATDQIPRRAVESGDIGLYGAVDPTTGGSSHRYSLAMDWQQPLLGGALQANVYGVKYDLQLFSNFTYFLDDPVDGDQFEQEDDRWYFGTAGSFRKLVRIGGISTKVQLGWEARQDRIDPVALHRTVAQRRTATIRRDEVVETSGGLYGQLDLEWTPWLHTIAGARYDRYRFDVESDDPRNSGTDGAGRASPKASLVLGPLFETELFGNFGYGFHSNDARGVTTTIDPATGEPVEPVTPLVPTRGGELGLRTEAIPGVQTSLALWRLDIDSELVFTGDAGTTEPSRPSRREGVEWSTRWQPVRWVLVDLDVAWSKARFTAPDPDPAVAGDHIPGSIESAVSGGVTVHDLGAWSGSVFLRYFGPRPLVEDDSVRSSASTMLNGRITYRFRKLGLMSLEVFNLLDARVDDIAYYYTSRLPGEPAPGIDDVHLHPAEKRSFRVTARFEY
jgi:hypothetical protein